MAKATAEQCVVCRQADQVARGCCRRCYRNARHMIEAGETTDAELVSKGIWRPKRRNEVREALDRR